MVVQEFSTGKHVHFEWSWIFDKIQGIIFFANFYLFQSSTDVASMLNKLFIRMNDRSQILQGLQMTGLKKQELQTFIFLTEKLEFMANFYPFEKLRGPSLKLRKHNENFEKSMMQFTDLCWTACCFQTWNNYHELVVKVSMKAEILSAGSTTFNKPPR